MLGRDYREQVCSISRALEVVGERWTLLVVRDVMLGRHRFEEIVESLGITRTVLTTRLGNLVDEGVLERRSYQDNPPRFEYHLTPKGEGLLPVLAELMWWGDRHYSRPEGPPRTLLHARCGGRLQATYACSHCGATLGFDEVTSVTGSGRAHVRS